MLFVAGVIVGAAFSGWNAAVRAGNEAATIQNLKTIAAVEVQYLNMHNRTFGTFEQLVKEQMLTSKFAGNPVIADGYVLNWKITGGSQPSYVLNADPRDEPAGQNHFYVDSTSEGIHVNAEKRASAADPIQ